MLRVMLVDDEPLARQGLRQQLRAFPDVVIVAEADRVDQALQLIQTEQPDGIFLDIQMPGSTGFDLLRKLKQKPKVVFVTAYSQYAVEAFEVDAVDYLLKPVSPERLAKAMDRLREVKLPFESEDRICLRTPERTVVAKWEAIPLLKAEGDFTRVWVKGEPPLLICQTLGSYDESLPKPPFVRLDRSMMVNLDQVLKVEARSRDEGKVYLTGMKEPWLLGRKALGTLKERLSEKQLSGSRREL